MCRTSIGLSDSICNVELTAYVCKHQFTRNSSVCKTHIISSKSLCCLVPSLNPRAFSANERFIQLMDSYQRVVRLDGQ